MPKRTDIKTILVLGSGPIVIGQGCEFDYSGTQACKTLRSEGYRIVLVNSNPATIMTDPAFSDRTYIEPITPEAVRKIIEKENARGPRIDAILPTLGGQTALNCACALWDDGTLQKHNIAMIGANREVIHRAEDRQLFKETCEKIGLKLPKAKVVNTLEDAEDFLKEIGLPAIIRPAFTLGGTGGGIAYNLEEYRDIVTRGLAASMITQVQIDQSVIGWKEFELEVVRDKKDNCIIVCGIENIDPMGVHTGDSITVAPILTLTDKEYQAMRDAAIAVMRAVGVETGGSNVQFAVNPNPKPGPDGHKPFEMVVVEMNPRVSRSSALASKATGFPIAKIAAKLAVGYTLDELKNDITGNTSACFEPAIDYIVVKMPRWTFEKFPEADETLTTQMKSVGEAMAIGRTFKEALQKVIRSMEVKRFGLGLDRNDRWLAAMRAVEHEQLMLDVKGAPPASDVGASDTGLRTADGQPIEWPIPTDKLSRKLAVPSQGRLYYVRYAMKMGWSIEKIHALTNIDPFFLDQIQQLVEFETTLCSFKRLEDVPRETLFHAKQMGYSDAQLANLYLGSISTDNILKVRAHRKGLGIEPVYKLVDTCAAEFEAVTPYYYSTYEKGIRHQASGISQDSGAVRSALMPDAQCLMPASDEVRITDKKKVIIIGGGPNRIGQGIEFDYCCVHAAFAAKELGFEAVMINSNPETVSTDYDTSDLLFFEPLTLEDTLNIVERLNGQPLTPSLRPSVTPSLVHGVIVQFGGQTPLNLAKGLLAAGAPIIGTSVDSIDRAEDRNRFDEVLDNLNLQRPAAGIARSLDEAVREASRIGYPVLIRPSYVLGGRGMEICQDETALRSFIGTALKQAGLDDAPVLIDKFLAGAIEVDVDVVADFSPERDEETKGRKDAVKTNSESGTPSLAVVAGIMEQIEQAGIHSGDSACSLPPASLSPETITRIEKLAKDMAKELRVNGLMNLQLAVKDNEIYVLEVNPRASRTVPFVGKATHIPWPAIAAKVMMGKPLAELLSVPASRTALDQSFAQRAAQMPYWAVKESVFPFSKFPGVDVVLGPEMRSTGEVMGIDVSLPIAFAKSQMAGGTRLPTDLSKGKPAGIFVSVREQDRATIIEPVRTLQREGFTIYATDGTGGLLQKHGIAVTILQKIAAGARPNVLDLMHNSQIAMIINTPTRTGWKTDEGRIRSTAVRLNIPMITTATAGVAAAKAIEAMRKGDWTVTAMQDFADMARGTPPPVQVKPLVDGRVGAGRT
ncbi:MAG TPA: carbamoyl-phosphate synthase large subunit [Phycisphaerales bacterium]|nr:carbamoyl-phosphate synthase large subunit [Phycisphaerales bacterium]